MGLADYFNVTVDEMLRDLGAQDRGRLLLKLDLPALRTHLEAGSRAIEEAVESTKAVEEGLSSVRLVEAIPSEHVTQALIYVMEDAGITLAYERAEDNAHRLTGTSAETAQTHTATGSDLYATICEVAQALGFDLEDWQSERKPKKKGKKKRKAP